MLAVEVQFINRSYASDVWRFHEEGGYPEWPPHPARLFSGLVSVCFETSKSIAEKRAGLVALKWLECQKPPEIAAWPLTLEGVRPMEIYAAAPSNGPKSSTGKDLYPYHRDLRYFPSFTPDKPSVFFVWRDSEPDDQTRDALSALLTRLSRLGSSRSLVIARVLDRDPLEPCGHSPGVDGILVPHAFGRIRIRVPREGALRKLNQAYNLKQKAPFLIGTPQTYAVLKTTAEDGIKQSAGKRTPDIRSHWSHTFFRKVGGPQLDAEAAIEVCESIRCTMMRIAGNDAPAALHGHDWSSHCIVAAIPSVGHHESDGHLLGVMIAVPDDLDATAERAVARVLAHLPERDIAVPRGTWSLAPASSGDRRLPRLLDAGAWVDASRWWASVTPVLLGRYPGKKLRPDIYEKYIRELRDIIADSCILAGLPIPEKIEASAFSFIPGSPPAARFMRGRRRDSKDSKFAPRFGMHVRLQFSQRVEGPVSIGPYRHFGMGLLKPVNDPSSDAAQKQVGKEDIRGGRR